jgi:hypothetical protein
VQVVFNDVLSVTVLNLLLPMASFVIKNSIVYFNLQLQFFIVLADVIFID